jgi:hypothetical protein
MIPIRPDAETREEYVQRIIAVWNRASEDQLARGRSWYRNAHDLAVMISDGNPVAGAGVIAALSAQASWRRNQTMAEKIFRREPVGSTRERLAKVAKIMAGADPAEVLATGQKTLNFYRCIVDPFDDDAVVIDRHAHDLAIGEIYGNRVRGLDGPRYALLAHCYREAAQRLGELPSTVQAVTWTVHVDDTADLPHRAAR